jgi:molecular chaperone DnaK (HSP70)
MSVVGVDFGTLNTVIAVARNRGVDVVCIHLPKKLLIGCKLIDATDHK